jgi:hypothetical protein
MDAVLHQAHDEMTAVAEPPVQQPLPFLLLLSIHYNESTKKTADLYTRKR